MEPTRNPVTAETLLAEASWVKSLAQRLVRDHAEAEDVVQETWLAALRSPAPEDGRMRPWLARVAINFARRARRGQTRRTRREERAARSEHLPSASEALERLELQRVLVDAIESLDEPYRMTVIRRHLDGMTAEEIARRDGVPASTVRWRLKKGIDELRIRLDGRFGGDRGAWALALVPLVHRPSLGALASGSAAAALEAAVQGGLAMNAVTKAGIALAVMLTASVGVWIATDEPAREIVSVPSIAAPMKEGTIESNEHGSSAPLELASAPVLAESARAPLSNPPIAGAQQAEPPTRLEARFIDRFEHPIAGVQLSLAAFADLPAQSSGDDGRVAIELKALQGSATTGLIAARDAFETYYGSVTMNRGEVMYLGDIRLGPGGSIAGTVLDPDGRPLRGAEVAITSPEIVQDSDESRVRGPSQARGNPSVLTGVDGSFRIDGVRAGLARVWASSDDTRWVATEPVEVPEASVLGGIEIRLVALESEDTIDGIVLSPTGEPVPNADVRYKGQGAGGVWSGNFSAREDGRFRHRVPIHGGHEFVARDPQGRWPDASAQDVMPGTHDLVLQFPPEHWLELTVRAHAGPPIDEYSVTVFSADGSRTLTPGQLEIHKDGILRLLVPGEPFKLDVRARGRAGAELGPWTPSDAPASFTCALERRTGVRGRVTHDGQPVAGARVALYELADAKTRIESNGFPTRLHPTAEDETESDTDGWFELDPARPEAAEGHRFFQRKRGERGEFAILGVATGFARAEVSPLHIDPAIGLDNVDVRLVRGGAIEGRVRTAPGKDPAGIVVAVDRSDGHPQTKRVGPDGAYRFEHLAPGAWNVTRPEQEVGAGSWSTSWWMGSEPHKDYPTNCAVHDGETTRHDLDLTDDRPCVLRASVSVNGLPAVGWTAKLNPSEGGTARAHPGGAVDVGGVLAIEAAEPGGYDLELAPPGDLDVSFETPVVLHRGDNVLPVELRVGSVRGRLASPVSDALVRVLTESTAADAMRCNASIKPSADGSFDAPIVMAGHARVCRMQIRSDGGTVGPMAEIAVDIGTGASIEVIVP